MTDFHDLQLKEQLLLQQKWEDDVDVDEGSVCDLCVRSIKPNKFFDKTPSTTEQPKGSCVWALGQRSWASGYHTGLPIEVCWCKSHCTHLKHLLCLWSGRHDGSIDFS